VCNCINRYIFLQGHTLAYAITDDKSNMPDPCQMNANTITESVLNEISYGYLSFGIVYQMASIESVSIYLPRDDPQDHTAMGITAKELYLEFERITGTITIPSHWPRRVVNGVLKAQNLPLTAILTGMPIQLTRDRYNGHQQDNGYSTDNAYRDGHWKANEERTEAIILTTFTENRFTKTPPNADSRDADMCICNVQSSFPGAEACFHIGEYEHLLWSAHVRYEWMIYSPHPLQLASILPPRVVTASSICVSPWQRLE